MGAGQIELKELSLNDGNDILEMLKEIGPGENGFGNDGYALDESQFRFYLFRKIDEARGINLKPGRVPETYYWLIADGHPVGLGKLRHYLNDTLRKKSGHVAYCIRPKVRGKGYGNIILSELLKKAREKNIPRLLVTSYETNIPSRRVIEHNGGELERIEGGMCFYWIRLTEGKGIREIHIDDYDEIHALWERTPGIGLSNADRWGNIQRFLSRNKGMSFCYEEDGKIVGTVLCGHDGRRGHIYHAAVAEEYRGRGIGRLLVERSLKKLKEEGIDKCHLFVYPDNETGNAFWKAIGWTKRGDILVYTRDIEGELQ